MSLITWLASATPTTPAEQLAISHLSGEGVEVGGTGRPKPVPPGTVVRHVDRYLPGQIAAHFPAAGPAARLDVAADATALPLASGSQDFVIASHVLEHLPDPLGALAEWARVLRPGGRMLLVVPDMRHTFDRARQRTPLEHVIADHRRRCTAIEIEHYLEYAARVEGIPDAAACAARARTLSEAAAPIHAHAWTADDLVELVEHAAAAGLAPLARQAMHAGAEVALLLARQPAAPLGPRSPWIAVRRAARAVQLVRREGLGALVRRLRRPA